MSRKKKVAGLLQRYEFIDFAKAVALTPNRRKDHLRAYLDRNPKGRWKSYKGLRSLVPDIAGVTRGLDLSGKADLETINAGLKLRCHQDDLAFNREAAKVLFNLLRSEGLDAYDDHPKGRLQIGPDRSIFMSVEHFVVEGERGVFRWVYPRREPLLGEIPRIVMSLIHHNYARDDFAGFDVQMVDLSCPPEIGPRGGTKAGRVRQPEIVDLPLSDIMPRDELNGQANAIYKILMELAEEN